MWWPGSSKIPVVSALLDCVTLYLDSNLYPGRKHTWRLFPNAELEVIHTKGESIDLQISEKLTSVHEYLSLV
jgi:hypothetical protein